MEEEIQIPILNDTILKTVYCVIELSVSYTNKPVYISCNKEEDYDRVRSKIFRDYRSDNYILAASKHS